jgi:hypothetical protein
MEYEGKWGNCSKNFVNIYSVNIVKVMKQNKSYGWEQGNNMHRIIKINPYTANVEDRVSS